MIISKQINKKNRSRLTLLLTVAVLLIAAAGVAVYMLQGSIFGQHSNTPTKTTLIPGSSTNSTTSNPSSDSAKGAATIDPGKTTNQVPIDSSLTATITDLHQSNKLIVFSGTTNDTKSGGTCSITFTNPNDRPVARTEPSTIVNGIATCAQIQIPESDFSYLGTWNVTFRYYINNVQATAIKTIVIQ